MNKNKGKKKDTENHAEAPGAKDSTTEGEDVQPQSRWALQQKLQSVQMARSILKGVGQDNLEE
eukprot:5457973-Prorocentrum_lima.AAC.1